MYRVIIVVVALNVISIFLLAWYRIRKFKQRMAEIDTRRPDTPSRLAALSRGDTQRNPAGVDLWRENYAYPRDLMTRSRGGINSYLPPPPYEAFGGNGYTSEPGAEPPTYQEVIEKFGSVPQTPTLSQEVTNARSNDPPVYTIT